MTSKFINKNPDKIEPGELNKNRELLLARLIGLLLTDGGLCQISGRRWRIHFTSNSKALTNEFEKFVMKLFNLRMFREYRKGSWRTQAWVSNKVKEELLKYSSTYRTLSENGNETKAIIPFFISHNNNLARNFLRYAFTGDGTVIFNIGKARYGYRFDRCVKIYCEHSNLRKQYHELLEKLGYTPTMLKDAVLLRKPENIKKFSREIGFLDNVRISGNGLWKGLSKSDLLKFAASSYGL